MTENPAPAPGWLVVQGRLRPDGDGDYLAYLAGTRPLLARHGGEVVAVGAGVESPHATAAWPINAVLRFPSVDAANAFLDDPDYRLLRQRHRGPAYDTLPLTVFAGRPPRFVPPSPDAP